MSEWREAAWKRRRRSVTLLAAALAAALGAAVAGGGLTPLVVRGAGGTAAVLAAGGVPNAAEPSFDNVPDATLRRAAELASPSIVEVALELTGRLRNSDGSLGDAYRLGFGGTGFFVASDGYIVTAAHVAAPSDEQLHEFLVDADIDVTYHCTRTTTESCAAVERAHRDDLLARTVAVDTSTRLRVFTQQMGADDYGLAARVVASSPSASRDVAVIKVDAGDAPVLLIGADAPPPLSTPLAVEGYPESTADSPDPLVPVVTAGEVRDVRGGDPGFAADATVVQTNAHIEHGNSGGPAIDDAAHVLGIVSYGPGSNVNFLVSAGDVRAVMQGSGADNRQGRIDQLWRDGLDAERRGDSSGAQQLFEQCAQLNAAQVGCRDHADVLAGRATVPPRPHRAAPAAVSSASQDDVTAALVGGLVIGFAAGVGATLAALWLRRRQRAAAGGWLSPDAQAAWWAHWYGAGAAQPVWDPHTGQWRWVAPWQPGFDAGGGATPGWQQPDTPPTWPGGWTPLR